MREEFKIYDNYYKELDYYKNKIYNIINDKNFYDEVESLERRIRNNPEEILDRIDVQVIESYLRKKKLEKLNENN